MSDIKGILLAALLVVPVLQAEEQLHTLSGSCSVTAATNPTEADLRLERGGCEGFHGCGSNQTQEPLSAFSGFTLADLQREGAHLDAVIQAEAGKITCSGAVHDGRLSGDYTFVPDPAFVARMQQMGFHDFDAEKLQAYTLFRIETSWIRSIQETGVSIPLFPAFQQDSREVRTARQRIGPPERWPEGPIWPFSPALGDRKSVV